MEVGDRLYVADKISLDKIRDFLSAGQEVWGFVEHMDVLSPTERITPLRANKNYTNISRDGSTGAVSLNDWADHPVLKANKPYMVKPDGTPDYALDPEDLQVKKGSSTASDISNIEYDGGAFAWFPRIYKYEQMEGKDRTVLFSMTPRDGYTPNGFIDPDGNVLEGVWLPMFYATMYTDSAGAKKLKSIAEQEPSFATTLAEERVALQNFSTRAQFLGGPIVETIIDFLMMISGTADLQTAFGYGNCGGYNSAAKNSGLLDNDFLTKSAFYGTDDKTSLNAILYSVVLGSYQLWQRDPYEVVVDGKVKVSKDYTYDPTGATYSDTGITVPTSKVRINATPAEYKTVPEYGSIPAGSMKGGSTKTGGCDAIVYYNPTTAYTSVGMRFNNVSGGYYAGPRGRKWAETASDSDDFLSAAPLLLPPAGVTV